MMSKTLTDPIVGVEVIVPDDQVAKFIDAGYIDGNPSKSADAKPKAPTKAELEVRIVELGGDPAEYKSNIERVKGIEALEANAAKTSAGGDEPPSDDGGGDDGASSGIRDWDTKDPQPNSDLGAGKPNEVDSAVAGQVGVAV